MNAVKTVARKELKTYFKSPVALIFLGIFLIANLFTFFGISHFFARNIADVRPFFQWLPLLLILLVSAITMRQWAEERKLGTFEILLTLPVKPYELVLGKFLAALALVVLALALTLPLPIMVSLLGPLDWGPVVGGYVAAVLLASTYIAIGLFVSSRTDNVVVSLMVTLVVGGVIYLIGTDQFTALFGNTGSELLRSLGTGSRFKSIERGVLDLRDLAYYLTLTVFFLLLNRHFLDQTRVDPGSPEGRVRTRAAWVTLGLVAANLLALNLWLAPVTVSRADLTAGGKYSISPVTEDILARLDEPLVIRGYFSERTHPALAPLVPEIRDLLAEYEIYGRGNVDVAIVNPNADEAVEQEINERYGIRPVPFRVADRHQQAVVNSYFHILVRYGDQYETLGFEDLVEVRFDENGLDVGLKNFEYDLTRTIKRVTQEFQSAEATLAASTEPWVLEAYISEDKIPDSFADVPERIRKVVKEYQERVGDRLRFEEIDPSNDPELQDRLAEKYDIHPLAADFFMRDLFYLDLVLHHGDKFERILPRTDLSESEIKKAIEAAVRRLTPGQLKTVGIFTEIPEAPPRDPRMPPQFQPPTPHPDYRALQQLLSADYVVETPNLDSGYVPEHIDVLIVGKTGTLTDHQRYAIDQFLMRGGKLIVLEGNWSVEVGDRELRTRESGKELKELLEHWGVEVEPKMVMDAHNVPFPVPVVKRQGPFQIQTIELLPYPFFPDVREDGFAEDHPALYGLVNCTVPWASPLKLDPPEGVTAEVLLRSSEKSWFTEDGEIQPDLARYPETGFPVSDPVGPQVLAATLQGRFPSFYADRPSPIMKEAYDESQTDEDDAAKEGDQEEAEVDLTGRTLKASVGDARLAVIGSSEIVSDLILQISGQTSGEVHRNNLELLENLVDWAVEDTELLAIRGAGSFARTLRPMSEEARQAWEFGQYALAILMVFGVAWVPRHRAKTAQAIVFSSEERS